MRELKQLPSIDNYSKNKRKCTEFIIERRETDKLKPDLNIRNSPLDWLLGQLGI